MAMSSTPTATSDLFAIDNARALIQGQENINRTKGSTGKALGSEEFNQPNKSNNNKFGTEPIIITSSHSFLISTLTLSILLFVLKPSILLNSTQLLSLSLFYY